MVLNEIRPHGLEFKMGHGIISEEMEPRASPVFLPDATQFLKVCWVGGYTPDLEDQRSLTSKTNARFTILCLFTLSTNIYGKPPYATAHARY